MDKTTSAIMATLFVSGVAGAADAPEVAELELDGDDSGYLSHRAARVVPEIVELLATADDSRDDDSSGIASYARAVRQLHS
jgi:hypothetical protein